MRRFREWQLQTAKARFSEVFTLARTEGPQRVTRRGKSAVVVVSEEDYDRLLDAPRPAMGLAELLRTSPLRDVALDLSRTPDSGRDVQL